MPEPASPAPGSAPPWTLDIEVILRDLDGLGHVNNAVYATYLESARTKYVAELAARPLGLDFDFILASLQLDFVSQATLGDVLRVMVWPTRLGRRSFDLAYRIVRLADGSEVLRATSVQVTYDYDERCSCPVPPAMAEGLRREIERCAPLQAPEPG
jgi:acyl-CoA thioester hydrolase